MLKLSIVLMLSFAAATAVGADRAECTIKIQDVTAGTDYTVTAKFEAAKNDAGRRKQFETPGADFSCTLAYFGLGNGTMLSCAFNGDMQHTFFQSDRTKQEDPRSDNYLTFRHRKAHFVIESKCVKA
jgi:hypothetical protein